MAVEGELLTLPGSLQGSGGLEKTRNKKQSQAESGRRPSAAWFGVARRLAEICKGPRGFEVYMLLWLYRRFGDLGGYKGRKFIG